MELPCNIGPNGGRCELRLGASLTEKSMSTPAAWKDKPTPLRSLRIGFFDATGDSESSLPSDVFETDQHSSKGRRHDLIGACCLVSGRTLHNIASGRLPDDYIAATATCRFARADGQGCRSPRSDHRSGRRRLMGRATQRRQEHVARQGSASIDHGQPAEPQDRTRGAGWIR